MKEAIAEYRALGQDKLADLGLTNNLAYALFYGGDYAGAYKAAQSLNPEPKALLAASMAMMQDSKAGLAEANKRSTDDNSFKDTARTAGEMLMNMRQYSQAADFLRQARPATMPRALLAWPTCCVARGATKMCASPIRPPMSRGDSPWFPSISI